MRLVLIADTFPPLRTSGSIQLRDLCIELVQQGFEITLLLPSHNIKASWLLEDFDGIQVLRLKSPKIKDTNYFRRTVNEFILPFVMYLNLQKSPLKGDRWDGVIWYSPSIFLAPLASILKKKNKIKSYLIIRDIFPNWAVDMKLLPKYSLRNLFFTIIAKYQYSVADFIGVQTEGNLSYFKSLQNNSNIKTQVLYNWLGPVRFSRTHIRIKETKFSKCKVFIYAGNMGVAQGLRIFLDLAFHFQYRKDIGFLFVGRGSEVSTLKKNVTDRRISNILFYDEIDPDEIGDLYSQCTAGIISLDPRHKSHNIPGKFLTYIQYGLPVLANINKGNDLSNLIIREKIGQVSDNNEIAELIFKTEKLIEQIEIDQDLPRRCISLFEKKFKAEAAAKQITYSLLT
jgi:glycosyltransferase involved in cell wall biosynthesis